MSMGGCDDAAEPVVLVGLVMLEKMLLLCNRWGASSEAEKRATSCSVETTIGTAAFLALAYDVGFIEKGEWE